MVGSVRRGPPEHIDDICAHRFAPLSGTTTPSTRTTSACSCGNSPETSPMSAAASTSSLITKAHHHGAARISLPPCAPTSLPLLQPPVAPPPMSQPKTISGAAPPSRRFHRLLEESLSVLEPGTTRHLVASAADRRPSRRRDLRTAGDRHTLTQSPADVFQTDKGLDSGSHSTLLRARSCSGRCPW